MDTHAARVAAGIRGVHLRNGVGAERRHDRSRRSAFAVDHVLAVNLKRVRDDDAAFKEATRRSSRRKYSVGESPAAPCCRRASATPWASFEPTVAGMSKAVGAFVRSSLPL